MINPPTLSPYEVLGNTLELNFHKHQWRAWDSHKRFILVLAGTQGGKTTFGPLWLHREMVKQGPGDYLIVAPSYPLLIKKVLPEFKRLFERVFNLGRYVAGEKKIFTVTEDGQRQLWGRTHDVPTQVFFGHAQDSDSLESATAKAAWLDECGQRKFKMDSFDAILRRLSIHQGRVLMTTTPYYIGWLKKRFWDEWQANPKHPEIDIIRFRSIDNPTFPAEEYQRAKASLPTWKFKLFYDALFTKPAGMIYDCFEDDIHVIPRFAIPADWHRFMGQDYGGVNTAAIYIAKDPQAEKYYAYREYHHGGRTAAQHADAMKAGEPMTPLCIGGAKSEGQWRDEFRAAGLPVIEPPVSDVEVGINRVYGAFKQERLYIFDDLEGLLDELGSYSRKLDDEGQPTEVIEDKNSYHRLDALRYAGTHLFANIGDLVLW